MEFQINSQIYSNISAISDIEITHCICTICINKTNEIHVSLFQAIASSPIITQLLVNDYTQKEFSIDVKFDGEVNELFYQKLEDVLKMKKITLNDDNEIVNFGHFGRAIGNKDFLISFTEKSKELKSTITKENAIEIIKKNVKLFLPISNYQKAIETIAINFEEKSEDLLNIANHKEYFDAIEAIIKNNKLKLSSEDSLLNFVLKLCAIDKEYENLFQYV